MSHLLPPPQQQQQNPQQQGSYAPFMQWWNQRPPLNPQNLNQSNTPSSTPIVGLPPNMASGPTTPPPVPNQINPSPVHAATNVGNTPPTPPTAPSPIKSPDVAATTPPQAVPAPVAAPSPAIPPQPPIMPAAPQEDIEVTETSTEVIEDQDFRPTRQAFGPRGPQRPMHMGNRPFSFRPRGGGPGLPMSQQRQAFGPFGPQGPFGPRRPQSLPGYRNRGYSSLGDPNNPRPIRGQIPQGKMGLQSLPGYKNRLF